MRTQGLSLRGPALAAWAAASALAGPVGWLVVNLPRAEAPACQRHASSGQAGRPNRSESPRGCRVRCTLPRGANRVSDRTGVACT